MEIVAENSVASAAEQGVFYVSSHASVSESIMRSCFRPQKLVTCLIRQYRLYND